MEKMKVNNTVKKYKGKDWFKEKLRELDIKVNEERNGILDQFIHNTTIKALRVIGKLVESLKTEGYDFYLRVYIDSECDAYMLDVVVASQDKSEDEFINLISQLYNRLKEIDKNRDAWFVGFDVRV